jgi:hypothetical protein
MIRRVLFSVLVVGTVATSGCGSSAPVQHSSAAQQAPATPTTETTETPSSASHPPPATAATWHFTWTHEGGYRYSASLSLSRPEHVEASAIAPCTAEAQTAAQVLGSLTLTNDTPNFSGKPYLNFSPSQPILFGGSETCYGEGSEGDNIGYEPKNNLAPGASSISKVALVIPNYYSPEHPDGNVEMLDQTGLTAQTEVEINGSEGAVPVKITGPSVRSPGATAPDEPSSLSLGPLAH